MKTPRISRRTLLRGIGGVAVALPWLEIMGPRELGGPQPAAAGGPRPPPRFLVSYAGCSTSSYYPGDLVVPGTAGPSYEMTRGLAPLVELGIRDHVTVVSGLKIPWQTTGEVPDAGRSAGFHYNTIGPQVSGVRTPDDRDGAPRGPTCDQIVADAIAGSTRFRLLPYRLQASEYMGSSGTEGTSLSMSWRRAEDGSLDRVDPIASPRFAFESLFTGFTPDDPEAAAQARFLLRQRRSVLDLVSDNARRLVAQVGTNDRRRLEQHFDEVRRLELRLDEVVPMAGSCRMLSHPGDDPPIGGAFPYVDCETPYYSTTLGYSDEERRGEVLSDLIAMAFACDLTRVCSYMLTEWKCYMNMVQVTGAEGDMHALTHNGDTEGVADSVAWLVRQWGLVVQKLRDMPEVDGTSVLDHSALVLLFEGGHGYDPEGDAEDSPHSTENMITLIAGRAGGLRTGLHIEERDQHPGKVVTSAMRALGLPDSLGQITGSLDSLFA